MAFYRGRRDSRKVRSCRTPSGVKILQFSVGSYYLGNNHFFFRVCAPQDSTVELRIVYPKRLVPIVNAGQGYFKGAGRNAGPGTRYLYRLGHI